MMIIWNFWGWCWWTTEFSSCETSPFLIVYFCLYLCLYLYLYLCLTMIISKKFRGWWSTEFSSCVPSPSLNTSNVIVASGKHSDSTSENFKPHFSAKWEKPQTKSNQNYYSLWASTFRLEFASPLLPWFEPHNNIQAPFRPFLTFTRTVTRCWQQQRFMSKVFPFR